MVMGKSYDWHLSNGLVVVNPRGLAKQSLSNRPSDVSAKWASKYGSVTFNQYGREIPTGGMNEAGLAIEVLWLSQSVFPPPDSRPALNELQVVQYLLDTCGTVAELIESMSRIRVSRSYGAVHYFTCDSTNACATVEYLEGKLVISTGDALPAKVITNNSCAGSVQALTELKKSGQAAPKGNASSARYLRAATMVESTRSDADLTRRSLEILDSVSQGDYTKWNIIYDLKNRKIHFRTRDAKDLKNLDLSGFDFSCARPARIVDINTKLKGDVTGRFEDYSTAVNEKLLRTSLLLTGVLRSDETIRKFAEYPSRLQCIATKDAKAP